MKRYVVKLEPDEREQLGKLVSTGKAAAYKIRHANILLAADETKRGPKLKDREIARGLGVSERAIEHLRKRFVEEGLEAALLRKKQQRPSVTPLLYGEKEARLVTLCCSQPPEGRQRWTLRLLADRMVELSVVESMCHETVRRALKKTS